MAASAAWGQPQDLSPRIRRRPAVSGGFAVTRDGFPGFPARCV